VVLFKMLIKDIRFWIILFFLLRLYGITNPPLEVSHNWRQTTVTMPARNFLEVDNNILFPRVDFAGEKTGITGMEFPLLNYLIYLMSVVFGYAHWYGRLINLFISSIGLFYFYKLVKKYFSESMAFNATFILLFSIWFTFSRKIMPDTFSVTLIIIGIYYGTNYLEQKNNFKNLMLYFFFVLFGLLSKLPSGCLLTLFIPFVFQLQNQRQEKFYFLFFSLVAVSISSIYYFYWVPYLTSQFQFEHFFMGKGIVKGMFEIFNDLYNAAQRFCLDALQVIAFILFVFGIGLAIKNKNHRLLVVFISCFCAFLLIVFKAGLTFTHHSYYMVPFVPVMALVAANAIEQINKPKIKWLLLMLILIEAIANKYDDFIIKPNALAISSLEVELNKVSQKDDLIAINSGFVPTPMYFAHRKGWICSNEQFLNNNYVEILKSLGLKQIVILKKVFGTEQRLAYHILFENEHYIIYQI